MAKKLIARTVRAPSTASTKAVEPHENDAPEHGLVGDIYFDPPLPPEELRRRFGIGITWEERLEQAQRQLAEGEDGF